MTGSTRPRWWRLATVATAFAIAGSGAVALAAPAAQATPTNCTTSTFLFGGQSLCTRGTGWHRVVLTCWGYPLERTVYGPWAIANTASLAFCSGGGVLGAGYETMG